MFDVRVFGNPEETHVNPKHVGEHVGILTNVINQEADFVELCKHVRDRVEKLAAGELGPAVHLGFVCHSGTHRSVACARLFTEILLRLGCKASCRHLCMRGWEEANKCSQCASCDLDRPDKDLLFERATLLYCRA